MTSRDKHLVCWDREPGAHPCRTIRPVCLGLSRPKIADDDRSGTAKSQDWRGISFRVNVGLHRKGGGRM